MDNQALINHAVAYLQSAGAPGRALLRSNGNPGVLRTNDVLRKEEWQQLDDVLVGVARQRLIGVGDLRSRGLTENLNGLGTILSQYEQLGDMSAANVDYAGVTDGEKDSVSFTLVSVPIPITHKNFAIDIRRLMASRGANAVGAPIDRTQVEVAAMKVAEQLEEVLFNGDTGGTVQSGAGVTTANSLLGYFNAPDVNSVSGSDWGTAANATTDIIAAIDKNEADKYWGPYVAYVSTTQFGQLRAFFTDGSGDQIFDRLKRLNGLEDVRPGDRLSDGRAVLVTMQRSVVDYAVGQDMTVVEWETKGGMQSNFKVFAASAPRVKSDSADGSGITKLTGI